jgi:hypothetical protein
MADTTMESLDQVSRSSTSLSFAALLHQTHWKLDRMPLRMIHDAAAGPFRMQLVQLAFLHPACCCCYCCYLLPALQHAYLQEAPANAALAMSLALQHSAISTYPRLLCAAACTCTAWREAVQQCAACKTAVWIALDAPLSRLCSFARWLPRHAALVSSLVIKVTRRSVLCP